MWHLSNSSDTQFRYLASGDVADLCTPEMALASTEKALTLHATGQSILPAEGYLSWETSDGAQARCLAMAGALDFGDEFVVGLKIISASLSNTVSGRKRSDGFTILFDRETARPVALMQAAHMSAQRTAAVSVIGARALAARTSTVGIVGCGTLGTAHAILLTHALPELESIVLFDLVPGQSARLAAYLAETLPPGRPEVSIAASCAACVRAAEILILATTTTDGYIPYGWINPGSFISHVSLDDLLPGVFELCDYLVVDDWALVSDDNRRVLGKMARAGSICGPDGPGSCAHESSHAGNRVRHVDATLGQVLTGQRRGPSSKDSIVVLNPFGMAILDVSLAHDVLSAARIAGRGMMLAL